MPGYLQVRLDSQAFRSVRIIREVRARIAFSHTVGPRSS
jgi:hypothetical protein